MPQQTPAPEDWPWPEELDALIAAPDNHVVILENERVRVLDTLIPPGETTPLHTHCWPCAMYVLSWGSFVRRDGDGQVLLDTRTIETMRESPGILWSQALPPHTLENVGTTGIRVISMELKEKPA